MGPGRPHYQLTASESWTRGSRPLTVLYLPGSPPLCHGPLSFGSDNEATDHPPAPTSGFGSSLIRQPLCSLLPGFVSDSPTTCWIIRIKSKSGLPLLIELEVTGCNGFLIICHFVHIVCFLSHQDFSCSISVLKLFYFSLSIILTSDLFIPAFACLTCWTCSEDCESWAGGLPAGRRPN